MRWTSYKLPGQDVQPVLTGLGQQAPIPSVASLSGGKLPEIRLGQVEQVTTQWNRTWMDSRTWLASIAGKAGTVNCFGERPRPSACQVPAGVHSPLPNRRGCDDELGVVEAAGPPGPLELPRRRDGLARCHWRGASASQAHSATMPPCPST